MLHYELLEIDTTAFLELEYKHADKFFAAEKPCNRSKKLIAQKLAHQVKLKERKEKEIVIRKSILVKKRTGQKLSAEEARAHKKLIAKAVAC
jgi:hypothetical protein